MMKKVNVGRKGCREGDSESVKQEPEKQQRRGKSDWPGAEKDTGRAEEQVWLTR